MLRLLELLIGKLQILDFYIKLVRYNKYMRKSLYISIIKINTVLSYVIVEWQNRKMNS